MQVKINYLINIRNDDIEKANEICVRELVDNNVNLSEGISDIAGFQLDKTIASSDFAYYIFNVIIFQLFSSVRLNQDLS